MADQNIQTNRELLEQIIRDQDATREMAKDALRDDVYRRIQADWNRLSNNDSEQKEKNYGNGAA